MLVGAMRVYLPYDLGAGDGTDLYGECSIATISSLLQPSQVRIALNMPKDSLSPVWNIVPLSIIQLQIQILNLSLRLALPALSLGTGHVGIIDHLIMDVEIAGRDDLEERLSIKIDSIKGGILLIVDIGIGEAFGHDQAF